MSIHAFEQKSVGTVGGVILIHLDGGLGEAVLSSMFT